MNKYLVLDTQANKDFRPYLIGSTVEGTPAGEYILTSEGNFLATELKEVQEQQTTSDIEVKSYNNITSVSYDNIINKYIVKEMDIDCIVEVENMDAIKVTGKGSKKHSNYIKSLVEQYLKNEATLQGLKTDTLNIINSIEYYSKNIIRVVNADVKITNTGEYIATLFLEYKNEYNYNRLAFIEINLATMEIINKSNIRNEEKQIIFNKFINMYNKIFLGGNNTPSMEDIKELDNKIDQLCIEYEEIQATRKLKGFSLAIYNCNDKEALKLIEIDNRIRELEKLQNEMLKEYKEQFYKQYSIKCIEAHKPFKDNRYKVIINNSKIIYTNDIQVYKEDRENNILINEYIDYNNTINKEVNMPILKTIYNYDKDTNILYTAIPHQLNYSNYKEVTTNLNTNKSNIIERGFDNNNNEIYWLYNDYLSIHNNFNSSNYISIAASKNKKGYYIREGLKGYSLSVLATDMRKIISKLLTKLKNNKNYNYNIENLKDILSI